VAPSRNALQDILKTCEEFAESHNLRFSTNPDPVKCKTKTLAFLQEPRPLPNMMQCGNPLPWTDKTRPIGIDIENKIYGCEHDMKVKRAKYIDKNIELNQEFFFAHPSTKVKLNQIYNSHYSGSPLWDLFGQGAASIEASFNRSVKVMLDLPFATHRSLIEPMTDAKHVKIIQRFLGFMDKIDSSDKIALKMLKVEAMLDVRSVTGRNYRNIMLLAGKSSVDHVRKGSLDLSYFPLDVEDSWKLGVIKEIIDAKSDVLEVPGFDNDELEAPLHRIG
jgi:hypothetical protein